MSDTTNANNDRDIRKADVNELSDEELINRGRLELEDYERLMETDGEGVVADRFRFSTMPELLRRSSQQSLVIPSDLAEELVEWELAVDPADTRVRKDINVECPDCGTTHTITAFGVERRSDYDLSLKMLVSDPSKEDV